MIPSPPWNERLVHVGVTRSGLVGRPRLQVLQEHLQTLYNDAGFCWANIGRILGISYQTLCCRRHEFGLQVGMGEHFSDVTDEECETFNVKCKRERNSSSATKRLSRPGQRWVEAQGHVHPYEKTVQ